MGGRANHGKTYYHCFKSNHFKAPINDKGEPNPCAGKWISARALEAEVWDTVTDLLQQPELLVRELEKLTQPDSPSRQALEEEMAHVSRRLERLPKEERRLVEGYRKGFYSDAIMRDEMGQVHQEQSAAQEGMRELQRQLAHMDRALNYQGQVEDLTVRLRQGLDSMGFSERRELLRLLVEQVVYEDGQVTIRTILPLEQLHPIPQGARGVNGTFEDRLVSEMRLARAATIAEANSVLPAFLPSFNARLGVPPAQPGSAYRSPGDDLDLASTLCIMHQSRVAKDNTAVYQQYALQLFLTPVHPSYAGATVAVHERLDSQLAVCFQGRVLASRTAPLHARVLRGLGVVGMQNGPGVPPVPERLPAEVLLRQVDEARLAWHSQQIKEVMEGARQGGRGLAAPELSLATEPVLTSSVRNSVSVPVNSPSGGRPRNWEWVTTP